MLSSFNNYHNRPSQLVTPLRLYRKLHGVTVFAALLILQQLSAQTVSTSVQPIPLEEINSSLRPLLQSAATHSWKMDLQEILVKRAEAVSMRYSASNKIKVSASVRAGYQRQDTATTTSDGLNYRFTVSARKPLYTWGAAEADHDYGLLHLEQAKQNRQLAFLTIYRDVVYKFIDYAVLHQRVTQSRLSNDIYGAEVELRRGQVERWRVSCLPVCQHGVGV